MSATCRVRKINGMYYPAFPDGYPVDDIDGYESGAAAYEAAGKMKLEYLVHGLGRPMTGKEVVKLLGFSQTQRLQEALGRDGHACNNPWHDLRGYRIRYVLG